MGNLFHQTLRFMDSKLQSQVTFGKSPGAIKPRRAAFLTTLLSLAACNNSPGYLIFIHTFSVASYNSLPRIFRLRPSFRDLAGSILVTTIGFLANPCLHFFQVPAELMKLQRHRLSYFWLPFYRPVSWTLPNIPISSAGALNPTCLHT